MADLTKRTLWRPLTYAVGAGLVGSLMFMLGTGTGEPKPCTAEKFHFPQIEKACKEGGRKAASRVIKRAMKNAKEQGVEFKCKSCHTDTKDWGLTPNAIEDLRPWL